MKEDKFPPGWNTERVQQVLAHYEEQTEEETVTEDEATFEDRFRLQELLDRQDQGVELSSEERAEAEGLVELVEFLTLIRLRSKTAPSTS